MRMLANGAPFALVNAEVTHDGYYSASKFHATLPLYGNSTYRPSFWDGSQSYDVEIQGGWLAAGAAEGSVTWQSLFKGTADEDIKLNMDAGTVVLSGRDYSGKLIDAKTAETFSNQTLAQIATTLAGRVGLTPNVSGTGQLAGQFYEIDHARTSHDTFSRSTSYWELITYMAQQEGYDVWVDGSTLNVQPKDSMTGGTAFTVSNQLTFASSGILTARTSNVEGLSMTSRAALAKDIQVTVKSWGGKRKAVVTGVSGPASAGQKVVKTFPNLSAAQCSTRANAIRAELGRHQRIVSFSMPGEFALRPRQPIAVQGTGTQFDATFFVAEIERRYSFEGGFWQSVTAKSLPPQDDQATP